MNHNGWNLRLVRQFLKKEEILLIDGRTSETRDIQASLP
jgi:hypothetical protein